MAETAYKTFTDITGGHDRMVTIPVSVLATLLDASVLPEIQKQGYIETIADFLKEDESG